MQQPSWIYEMLSEVRRLPHVRVVATIVAAARNKKTICGKAGPILRFWSSLERRWVEGQRDALAPIDCAPLLAETENLTIDPSRRKQHGGRTGFQHFDSKCLTCSSI